jgi:hypothetical protein
MSTGDTLRPLEAPRICVAPGNALTLPDSASLSSRAQRGIPVHGGSNPARQLTTAYASGHSSNHTCVVVLFCLENPSTRLRAMLRDANLKASRGKGVREALPQTA